jgi:putative redox protein
MVEITVVYEGELRCRARHGPSGNELWTDAPVDNNGRGESFSPTDLVATALGTCMLTVMGIVAQRHGWDLRGTTARVEKRMVSDPRRRIGSLVVLVRGPAHLDQRARTALETAALSCPVHSSLGSDIEKPVTFEWDSAA